MLMVYYLYENCIIKSNDATTKIFDYYVSPNGFFKIK